MTTPLSNLATVVALVAWTCTCPNPSTENYVEGKGTAGEMDNFSLHSLNWVLAPILATGGRESLDFRSENDKVE